MLNENLEIFSQIKFKCLSSTFVFNTNYNYINDMILVLTNFEIYQINFKTKEVVTIYNSPYLITYYFNNLPFYDSIVLYNYNEKTQRLEEIIIIMEKTTKEFYKLY